MSLKINLLHRVPSAYSVRGRRSQRHFYSLNILPGYSTSSEKLNPLGRIRGLLSSLRVLVIIFTGKVSVEKESREPMREAGRKQDKKRRKKQ